MGVESRISPGPDFWSWSPPEDDLPLHENPQLQPLKKANPFPKPAILLLEKENSEDIVSIPFESTLIQGQHVPPLPPLQSLIEVEDENVDNSFSISNEDNHDELSARNSFEIAEALAKTIETSSHGVNPDGTKWWKSSGIEEREDGVVYKWTLIRGVSVDGAVEWEDKFWEAADEFDYKELGSEKSGRDASGNVWREFWKETISQVISVSYLFASIT